MAWYLFMPRGNFNLTFLHFQEGTGCRNFSLEADGLETVTLIFYWIKLICGNWCMLRDEGEELTFIRTVQSTWDTLYYICYCYDTEQANQFHMSIQETKTWTRQKARTQINKHISLSKYVFEDLLKSLLKHITFRFPYKQKLTHLQLS